MIELSYNRLLQILNKVDEEEGKYVLYFLQHCKNRYQHKIRQLEAERQEYEQARAKEDQRVQACEQRVQACEQKMARLKQVVRDQMGLTSKAKALMVNVENLLTRILRQEGQSLDPKAEKVMSELMSVLERRMESGMW